MRHAPWLAIIAMSTVTIADTLHVPADYPTIQAAIDAAIDGDIVLVADGTYTGEGNRDMSFGGKAITVRSENGPEACVIDIQGSEVEPHRAFTFDAGEGPDSVVEGFTIENGYASQGGAVLVVSESDPLFQSCIFQHNTATGEGR